MPASLKPTMRLHSQRMKDNFQGGLKFLECKQSKVDGFTKWLHLLIIALTASYGSTPVDFYIIILVASSVFSTPGRC